jgi:lipoprotein-anchoring transpeptidase ErfK/SrfK
MRRVTLLFLAALLAAAVYSVPGAAYAQWIFPGTTTYYDQGYPDYRPQRRVSTRGVVSYRGYAPGTVVISTAQRRLYYIMGSGQAISYAVGVGRPGFQWGGTHSITRKREWPDWRPPAQMLRRRPDLPRYMSGGINNPLGARAMYLGSSLFRIHGSNEPHTIGTAVSSGCIRMTNADVIDLYSRVRVGTRVVVLR